MKRRRKTISIAVRCAVVAVMSGSAAFCLVRFIGIFTMKPI